MSSENAWKYKKNLTNKVVNEIPPLEEIKFSNIENKEVLLLLLIQLQKNKKYA